MNNWIVIPIVLPLVTGLICALIPNSKIALQRTLALASSAFYVAFSFWMLSQTFSGEIFSYAMGNWSAPFGITVVVDRLAALMVTLTSVVAFLVLTYAVQGTDKRGPYFHFLYQFQVLGITGAFMTGDLFNLFVFFEILLLSSYNLLVYSGGKKRIKAGIHYVALNLVGSALFLIGVSTLYGVTGSLNMADMALSVAALGPEDQAILQAGGLILMVVFALKAALLPLYLWLPSVYGAATAPVAALFAILTKVGVYAILRTSTLIFGPEAGVGADLIEPYLFPLALMTLFFGMVGAMGSRRMRPMIGYLIISSLGSMLASIGLFSQESISGAVYYMVHSTLIMGLFFLLVERISLQRGPFTDEIRVGWKLSQPGLLGLLFFGAAVAAAGLPPLSGFLGKLLMLQAAITEPGGFWLWVVLLLTSLLGLVALSRVGTEVIWKGGEVPPAKQDQIERTSALQAAPLVAILAVLATYSALAGPITEFTDALAAQLLNPEQYIEAVMVDPVIFPDTGMSDEFLTKDH
ncbi:monovalent cation/H+ antiporter subunit D [Lujinxingia litoralis]|uniref:Monovalent cation/H+ antiporter subunit D n=1 Tax=Lujinxingia litoralis TaxID=2211119 RepID=A0A328C4V0_9DELT|nr:monovalent cation/H+ antiporter subunit D [Lujinxingia litoralis]RAL20781.1 monovalent cation/H+ antiporter subunit D [Lujinxingia litoralis]